MKHKLLMLRHHWIAHPLTGLCYLLNLEKTGDWIHNNW
jgi:hypothetical protein